MADLLHQVTTLLDDCHPVVQGVVAAITITIAGLLPALIREELRRG